MKDTSQKVIDAIKEYQEPGSVNDFDENNFNQNGVGVEWSDHHPGTFIIPGGVIFLGMPRGFNKATIQIPGSETLKEIKIQIYVDFNQKNKLFGEYNFLNLPVWKHLNEKGHTFIRGVCPRLNKLFLHVIIEDCMDKINCFEITKEIQETID